MTDAAPFCPAKFRDPTPEDLDLPSDPGKLYALEATFAAPRAAWRAYYEATGGLHDIANAKRAAREARKRQLGAAR